MYKGHLIMLYPNYALFNMLATTYQETNKWYSHINTSRPFHSSTLGAMRAAVSPPSAAARPTVKLSCARGVAPGR